MSACSCRRRAQPHPKLVEAARAALPDLGFGMSSVRLICGTQSVHKELARYGVTNAIDVPR